MLHSTQSLPGTAAVVNAVKKDVNGIGYGGAAYAVGVKHAKVKKDANSTAYLPSTRAIAKDEYPIYPLSLHVSKKQTNR